MEGRVVQVDPDGTILVDLEILGRSTRAELDVTLLGFDPPGPGTAGSREPRRPTPAAGPSAAATPRPETLP